MVYPRVALLGEREPEGRDDEGAEETVGNDEWHARAVGDRSCECCAEVSTHGVVVDVDVV